ncbi:MAG: molybdenum cofactor biosynthesis protein MoaE [Helicobacter sp.]|uniref:molybdopterin synthase catalytic subunit n=1 Tax=Helicobacter sp. TaxID=218 RepID=UPI0025C01944|nr:molybdenum cofactor biosynthesis protein MoaE [Helicobacter sp.]MCH5313265.1 molybdenum cofactor biosynthesis protein MoaE [Helicobacter sp.]
MLSLYQGALPTYDIYIKWESLAQSKNAGALSIFTGIVREEIQAEGQIEALSFDIYEPLLQKWFDKWQQYAQKEHNAYLCMAHSIGDVSVHQSSYMCGIISSNRKGVLSVYELFIEDFKANAPIWKYDVIHHRRIYAKERSKTLAGSGILAPKSF